MDIKTVLDRYYYDMVVNELRLMHDTSCQKISHNTLLYLDLIVYKQNCTVSFLADALKVAKSAVTLKVNELEKLGIVTKIQSQTDKRVFYLSVKPKVLQEYKIYDKVFYSAIDKLEQKYTKQQLQLFCEMMGSISNSFEEHLAQNK